MKLKIFLMMIVSVLAVSCSSTIPYQPATKTEKFEYSNDHINIYPEDVRKFPDRYTNTTLVWTGIIVTNSAREEEAGGKIRMETLVNHRYFNWEQDRMSDGTKLLVSPRGEGFFTFVWEADRVDPAAGYEEAMKYAAPGKLAVVYATPKSVDDDGTIVMKYHYVRIIDRDKFSTDVITYGRVGQEPFKPVDYRKPSTPASSATH